MLILPSHRGVSLSRPIYRETLQNSDNTPDVDTAEQQAENAAARWPVTTAFRILRGIM